MVCERVGEFILLQPHYNNQLVFNYMQQACNPVHTSRIAGLFVS